MSGVSNGALVHQAMPKGDPKCGNLATVVAVGGHMQNAMMGVNDMELYHVLSVSLGSMVNMWFMYGFDMELASGTRLQKTMERSSIV